MKLSGWGNFPEVDCQTHGFDDSAALAEKLKSRKNWIPRGNGRSYGDSALGDNVMLVKPYHLFLDFDEQQGVLHVQAGVLLSEILESFVPRGWFLKITPGTKLITVGGAIASDVHGKNHHVDGCFSECVVLFRLMLPSGEVITCSKQQNPELFKATCGGMGLTGIILDAKIALKKINSKYIYQTTIKTRNLSETFAAFEQSQGQTYSVAWIDCLAKKADIGRCLLMTGEFCDDGRLDYRPRRKLTVPFMFPSFVLNNLTVKAFNLLYYAKSKRGESAQTVDIDSFFYPLDGIDHWNRIYGEKGFTQYQFILPKDTSYTGLTEILAAISASGKGSFLAVLKLYGKANNNFLSFPFEGYSLALDFKIEPGLLELLNQLDDLVLEYGGRLYLAKDARMSQEMFDQGYPGAEKFRQIRAQHQMNEMFNSTQSRRVGI